MFSPSGPCPPDLAATCLLPCLHHTQGSTRLVPFALGSFHLIIDPRNDPSPRGHHALYRCRDPTASVHACVRSPVPSSHAGRSHRSARANHALCYSCVLVRLEVCLQAESLEVGLLGQREMQRRFAGCCPPPPRDEPPLLIPRLSVPPQRHQQGLCSNF